MFLSKADRGQFSYRDSFEKKMTVYSLFVPGNVAFISCLAVLSNSAAPTLKIFTSAKMAANCSICHLTS